LLLYAGGCCDTCGVEERELEAHLDNVLIGGRERREIVIADYDPAWPRRFELERARIGAALGGVARRIEHIGSTAVPGLAAKPIVDALVAVGDVYDSSAFEPALVGAGYELRVREPEHRMFRTPERDVHVHVWDVRDPEVDRHLAFRDRLRASPDDRERYEQLKRTLAQRDWSDMNHYAEAKRSLVAEILARAAAPDGRSRGSIRPVRLTDAPAIAALLGELGHPTEADEVVPRLEHVLGRDAGILIYALEREPVGLITYQLVHLLYRPRPHCRVTALVVREDRRRRGIARALLAAVESLARERACSRLEVTTRPDRGDALGLYLASGFSERPLRLVKHLSDR
jgi:GrpB-like predicted nucleotidyltransferase (UPF0157 family)/ribosomal protein S18 acetylase RimI-like enzyme